MQHPYPPAPPSRWECTQSRAATAHVNPVAHAHTHMYIYVLYSRTLHRGLGQGQPPRAAAGHPQMLASIFFAHTSQLGVTLQGTHTQSHRHTGTPSDTHPTGSTGPLAVTAMHILTSTVLPHTKGPLTHTQTRWGLDATTVPATTQHQTAPTHPVAHGPSHRGLRFKPATVSPPGSY